ncbi:MAG: hypothetical protein A2070_09455, partial [Bdellovibrionales bacterium GWC1_52_8]
MALHLTGLQQKWASGLLAFGAAAGLYALTNRFLWHEPRLLQLTFIDHTIPFLPSSIWIYMSAFLFLPWMYHRTLTEYRRNLLGFMGLVAFSAAIFLIYPVRFPRELYPLEGVPSFTHSVFSWLRGVDAPVNCMPSLHASVIAYVFFNYVHSQKRIEFSFLKISGYGLWTALILLSTLTTKQHYVFDILAGALLGYGFFRLFVPSP